VHFSFRLRVHSLLGILLLSDIGVPFAIDFMQCSSPWQWWTMRKFLTTVQLKDSAFDTGLSQLWDPNVLSSSLSRQCIWGIGATQVSQDGRAAITYVRSWCSCPACWFSRLAVLIMCTYTLLCLWPHYWPRLWHYCKNLFTADVPSSERRSKCSAFTFWTSCFYSRVWDVQRL
jgi:hypothetical protein